MSHEQINIVIGEEGVHTRCNCVNGEEATFFYSFLRVSQGLLLAIVGLQELVLGKF